MSDKHNQWSDSGPIKIYVQAHQFICVIVHTSLFPPYHWGRWWAWWWTFKWALLSYFTIELLSFQEKLEKWAVTFPASLKAKLLFSHFFVSFLPQTEKYDYFQECPTSGNLAGDNEGVSNVVRSDPRPRRHFVPSPGDHRLVGRNCNTEVSLHISCFSVLLIWWKCNEI